MKMFYLNQSIYIFDPFEMAFTCIVEAAKIEELNIELGWFVNAVKQKQCTPQSKS